MHSSVVGKYIHGATYKPRCTVSIYIHFVKCLKINISVYNAYIMFTPPVHPVA